MSEDLSFKNEKSVDENLSAIQFTRRIAGLLAICIEGINGMVAPENPFRAKLIDLKGVLEKVKPEMESASGKAFQQFFEDKIADEELLKAEKKELKEMILSLGNTIKEFAVYSGGVGDSLSGHIDKMIDSEATDDILKIKNAIILEANKIKEETQDLKGQLETYKEKTSELTKRLEETEAEAFMDSLTGVYNRNAYNSEIVRFIKEYERYKNPFGFIVLDIDYFKKVNDTYGHDKGDVILQVVADVVKKAIRETDRVFRYGGEEFVIWLDKVESNTAIQAADKIRRMIESKDLSPIEKGLTITASLGITCVREADTAATVFKRADKALYRAKKGGRNQVNFEK